MYNQQTGVLISGRLKKKLVNDIIQCIYDMNYIQ